MIPYNQTNVKDKLRCPSDEHIKEFQRIVTSYGTFCSVRRTMGADIASACGQLVVKKEKKNGVRREPIEPPADLEDGPFAKASTTPLRAPSSSKVTRRNNKAVPKAAETSSSYDHGEARKSLNDLERWIPPLAMSTALAATCFVVSCVLFLRQRRR